MKLVWFTELPIPNLLMDLSHLWDEGTKLLFSHSENTSAKSMFLYNTYAKYHSHKQYHHRFRQKFHVDMLRTSWHQFLITCQSTKEVLLFSSKTVKAHTANTVLTWMQDDSNLKMYLQKNISQGKIYLSKSKMIPQNEISAKNVFYY